jgi:hypothetical protein
MLYEIYYKFYPKHYDDSGDSGDPAIYGKEIFVGYEIEDIAKIIRIQMQKYDGIELEIITMTSLNTHNYPININPLAIK